MIKQLVAGQEAVLRTARELLPVAEKAGDQPTVDLLSARMEVHEQNV
jgi:starvation-inducible DNA-binding protein